MHQYKGVWIASPQSLRAQFHEMGRTPIGERVAGTYAREILNCLPIDLSWASSRVNDARKLTTCDNRILTTLSLRKGGCS